MPSGTRTTAQLLETVIAHDEAHDRPAAVLEQAYLLLALHLEHEAHGALTADLARSKRDRAEDCRRRARRLGALDCDDCRDTGRVWDGVERIPCELCGAGREAMADDCDCDDGLVDDGYEQWACRSCPAGDDFVDAELSARDSAAEEAGDWHWARRGYGDVELMGRWL